MPTLISLLLRLLFLTAGLVFAASLALVFLVLAALWLLRAAWARLTGQPVAPFVTSMHPRGGFAHVYRRAAPASRTGRADAASLSRVGDVTGVEPKERL